MDTWHYASRFGHSIALDSTYVQLHKFFISSEKNFSKIRVGLVSYSPELFAIGLTWYFWHKVVHYKQHRFKDCTYLCRTTQSLGIITFHIPLKETIHNLKSAKKACLTAKQSH